MPRTAAAKGRPVPRPFEFHWGKGQITEEACFAGEHTEPAIQLLEYAHGLNFLASRWSLPSSVPPCTAR